MNTGKPPIKSTNDPVTLEVIARIDVIGGLDLMDISLKLNSLDVIGGRLYLTKWTYIWMDVIGGGHYRGLPVYVISK